MDVPWWERRRPTEERGCRRRTLLVVVAATRGGRGLGETGRSEARRLEEAQQERPLEAGS
jgi:hypothetical protein